MCVSQLAPCRGMPMLSVCLSILPLPLMCHWHAADRRLHTAYALISGRDARMLLRAVHDAGWRFKGHGFEI